MPVETFNGVRLYYEDVGAGDPLVLVHGSWVDHHTWDRVVPALAARMRVVTYDRRGHSQSERPAGQGSVHDDVTDLASIIETLGLAPAHVMGSSFGGSIALRLAGERPELFRSLAVHEPPLFGLLTPNFSASAVTDLLIAGDSEGGARQFVEMGLGRGAWTTLVTPEVRATMIGNAPTFLDEECDPESRTMEPDRLATFAHPAMLSVGSAMAPMFTPILDRIAAALPAARRYTFEGSGHVPHESHAEQFIAVAREFVQSAR